MSARKLALVTIVCGVVVFTGCSPKKGLIRGGPPAGPIIVIQPDPEPGSPVNTNPKGKIQCASTTEPCWYLGSFDRDHFDLLPDHVSAKSATGEDPPKLPYFLINDATVHHMEIRLKTDVKTPIEISKIELTLESGPLVIEVESPNVVPTWTFRNVRIEHKRRPREHLPRLLLTRISAISVTERPGQPSHGEISIGNLKQLRIYYNQ